MKSAIMVGVLISLASVAMAKSPVKPAPLNAYDANGKKVGRVWDMGGESSGALSEAKVPVNISGTAVVLAVHQDGLDTFGHPLVYTSTDCTGTGYLILDANPVLPPTTVAAPGWTVYAQQPGSSEQTITFNSQRRTGACTLDPPTLYGPVVPAVPLVDLSTLFAAPFSVH